jgi:DNA-binding NtrC family response regulator
MEGFEKGGYGKRILLIDDDDDIRILLSEVLSQEGYDVYEAQNGAEGLREMRKRHHDAVLSDYHMPRMDGTTFLEISRMVWPETPVILASCDPEFIEGSANLARGAYACLSKPFDLDRLLETVMAATEQSTRQLQQSTV